MKKLISFVSVLSLILIISLSAAAPKKPAFDAQAAWTYIRDMATDAMLGRRSGHPGGETGAAYVEARFREWGLEPAGTKGYSQEFTLDYSFVEPVASLEIITSRKKREFLYSEDWRTQRFSGSGAFMAEIVYAGYGISAPEKGYDDFAGVDVKGKWVLFSIETPARFQEKYKDEAQLQARVKAARDLGARGVMTFQGSAQPSGMGAVVPAVGFRIGSLTKDIYRPDFVILSLNDTKIVDMIFKDLPTELRYHVQQIEQKGMPQSFATGIQAMVKVKNDLDEKRATRNVLAKITGSDPKLRNECVIIGGHMDHLGIDAEGDVNNGANDNASGTAVAMEIGRAMKAAGIKPRRTIIFAAWAGEEQGLLGSKHYVEYPTFPIEKTVAYINMDMVGHGDGKIGFPGIYYGPEIWDLLKTRLPKDMLADVVPSRGGPGGSDHSYFLYQGVPAFATMTEGYHFKYHRSGDDISLIKKDVLQKVGDFVMACVGVLADEPKNLILPMRRETYWWKYATVVNFAVETPDEILAKYKDVPDPEVDMQFALLAGKEGLAGDALRVGLLKMLLDFPDRFKDARSLILYGAGGPGGGMAMMRGGGPIRTSVVPGLVGSEAFKDDPRWLDILSKQGVAFIALDDPSYLFAAEGLNEAGKSFVEQLNKTTILLFVMGLNGAQAKSLLETSKKPFVLLEENLPSKEILNLIDQKGAAVGLFCNPAEDAAGYVKKIEDGRKAVGTDNLIMVFRQSLWEKPGKEQVMRILAEMFKAKFDNGDLQNLFAGTLNRTMAALRP